MQVSFQAHTLLRKTAQAIYKHWFVDFEFPISAEYAASIGKPELEGKPYKSSGGEMVFCEELDQEIPKDWTFNNLGSLINIKHGFAFKGVFFTEKENENILLSPGNFKIGGGFKLDGVRYYSGSVPNNYVFSHNDIMITMTDLSKASDTIGYPALIPYIADKKFLHNQRLGKIEYTSELRPKYFLYSLLRSFEYRTHVIGGCTGTTVKHTSPSRIMDYKFLLPKEDEVLTQFEKLVHVLYQKMENIFVQNMRFNNLQNLIYAKMSLVITEKSAAA